MTRLTPAWTDRHTTLVVAVALIAVVLAAGVWEPWPAPVVLAIAAVGAFALALAFDPFVGVVVGLGAAAGSIAAKRLAGLWSPDAFVASSVETVALVLVGLVAGIAGRQLRVAHSGSEGPAPSVHGTLPGSLGLLPLDLGMLRLQEEVERARLHGRPLAVLRMSLNLSLDPGWGTPERQAIERTVARLVESLLRVTDVPFGLDGTELGAVLPETSSDEAWRVVIPILDAITAATFVVRSEADRHSVGSHADIRVGLAFLAEHGSTAEELLDAATAAVRDPDGDATGVSTVAAAVS